MAPQVPLKNGWNDPLRMIHWGCSREEQNDAAWIQWVFTLFHNIYIIWVISSWHPSYIRHLSFQSPGRPDFQVDLWPDHQARIRFTRSSYWEQQRGIRHKRSEKIDKSNQHSNSTAVCPNTILGLEAETIEVSLKSHLLEVAPGAKGIRRCQKPGVREESRNMAGLLHLRFSLTTRNCFNVKICGSF